MAIGIALGWGNTATIALAVVLAFFFGYSFTTMPLLSAGMAFGAAIKVAPAADTISITIMEVIDNAIILVIPGAMTAGLRHLLFWASRTVALLIAGAAASRSTVSSSRAALGHALVHEYHGRQHRL